MTDAISISFCINDRYSQHLAVVIASILRNNPQCDFVFHVLHHNVTPVNQTKIRELERCPAVGVRGAGERTVKIVFHAVDPRRFLDLPLPPALEHVTREMYYRFLLPEVLLDEGRTIYMDSDVLCVANILPLWRWDLENKLLGAISEGFAGEYKKELIGLPGPEPYFCSGLLVMDLAALRTDGFGERFFDSVRTLEGKLSWPDQDAINHACRGRIAEIPSCWCCADSYSLWRKDVAIWHFQGATQKPWCNIWKNRTWPIYLRYLVRTPFRWAAVCFVLKHLAGIVFFKYRKKGVMRYYLLGIRIWRSGEVIG